MKKIFGPLETPLFVYVYEKRYRVAAIFTTDDDTNRYLEAHPTMGVLAECKPFIFVAELTDKGVK